jgi:hypothetical protein
MAKPYYILSMLPTIESLGAPAPLTAREFLDLFEPDDPLRGDIEALFLTEDLLLRQATLAGRDCNGFAPAVLSRGQITGELDLPEALIVERTDDAMRFIAPEDALWERYYEWLADLAKTRRSKFLSEWTRFEVGLRNALAAYRADALDLDVSGYLIAESLGGDQSEFAAILNDLQTGETPLDQKEILDLARWAWLNEHDEWFTFDEDEILAYAVRLLLTTRWERINDAADEAS